MSSTTRQQQLEWRRSQVLELSSEGYSIREIAQRLRVDKSAVNRDIQFLRHQAQDNLRHHISETIPELYQQCMTGMKRNLKQTLEISEQSTDPRIKLEARKIVSDCYRIIMDLCTSGPVISDSIKFITQKQEQLDLLCHMSNNHDDIKAEATNTERNEEGKTTNGVF